MISAIRTPPITPNRSINIPAEKRRDHDRQPFDDRLNADAHRVAICFECGRDQRKSRRQRKTAPGKKQKHSDDDRAPMRNQKHERVTDDRDDVENQKRAAMSPTIDHHAAGIGVNRAEQCPNGVVKTDDKNGGAEVACRYFGMNRIQSSSPAPMTKMASRRMTRLRFSPKKFAMRESQTFLGSLCAPDQVRGGSASDSM